LHSAHAVAGSPVSDNHVFVPVSDKKTWAAARQYCRLEFGYPLATIDGNTANAAVFKACQEAGGNCWIGLRNYNYKEALAFGSNKDPIKEAWERDATWDATGTNLPFFSKWKQGEPNNHCRDCFIPGPAALKHDAREGCTLMTDGTWIDKSCDTRRPFVCGPRPPEELPADAPECDCVRKTGGWGGCSPGKDKYEYCCCNRGFGCQAAADKCYLDIKNKIDDNLEKKCGCKQMTVMAMQYHAVAGDTGNAVGAFCRSDQDEYDRCCCNSGFGCQSGSDRCEDPNESLPGDNSAELCDDPRTLADGAWFSPLDLPGHPRTVDTVEGCRQRCEDVPECYYFNNFPNGGCHLAGKNAKVDYSHQKGNPTRAAGIVRCASVATL